MTLPSTPSTNSALAAMCSTDSPHGLTVATPCQSAGRGQRGNSWEAEPGKNLTFSTLLRPTWIEAAGQFAISEAVSLAVVDFLDRRLRPCGMKAAIKWPNDIYVGDCKICGILIENTIAGKTITRSIAGIGVNINQTVFRSDAPNPTSLALLTGRQYPLQGMIEEIVEEILKLLTVPDIHKRYISRLWRRTGLHPYVEPGGEAFMASIQDIAPTGHLSLKDESGRLRTFAFKEVAAVLPGAER